MFWALKFRHVHVLRGGSLTMKLKSPSLVLAGVLLAKRARRADSLSVTPTHTLLLCRHGDSVWNGGMPGYEEIFTGWTDVPLSRKGHEEAVAAGEQVASYSYPIDVCFTSILHRAQETATYCLDAYEREKRASIRVISDYRLNERHYGALQGLSKRDVGDGLYGHDPKDVKAWRRSWYAVPPPLADDDPRRLAEIQQFAHLCGSIENVPTGESLEFVAKNRIRPFLDEVLVPSLNKLAINHAAQGTPEAGATGLVVAHANSLRTLLGVVCEVEDNPAALQVLESLRIPTGVPLIVQFQKRGSRYHVCQPPEADECMIDSYFDGPGYAQAPPSNLGHPDLPAWPLDQCIPVRKTVYAIPPQRVRQNSAI